MLNKTGFDILFLVSECKSGMFQSYPYKPTTSSWYPERRATLSSETPRFFDITAVEDANTGPGTAAKMIVLMKIVRYSRSFFQIDQFF